METDFVYRSLINEGKEENCYCSDSEDLESSLSKIQLTSVDFYWCDFWKAKGKKAKQCFYDCCNPLFKLIFGLKIKHCFCVYSGLNPQKNGQKTYIVVELNEDIGYLYRVFPCYEYDKIFQKTTNDNNPTKEKSLAIDINAFDLLLKVNTFTRQYDLYRWNCQHFGRLIWAWSENYKT